GVGEGVCWCVFDDEPGDVVVEGPFDVAGSAVGGDDEAADGGVGVVELPGHGEAVTVRHFDVQYRDVGVMGVGGGEGLLAGAGLGDDLDVGVAVEQGADGFAEHALVVSEQDPDRGHDWVPSSAGRSIWTAKAPGVLWTAMLPPAAATRSRSVRRPDSLCPGGAPAPLSHTVRCTQSLS